MSTSETPSNFGGFQDLPTELKMMIWRLAASVPRVVYIQGDTTESRTTKCVVSAGDVQDPHAVLRRVDYLSWRVWSEVHSIRLEIPGPNDLSESYNISDDDIVIISLVALYDLVLEYRSAEPRQGASRENLKVDDQPRQDVLLLRAGDGTPTPKNTNRPTSGGKALPDSHIESLSISSLRGDLEKIKRLIVHDDDLSKYWPNLLKAPEVPKILNILEQAVPGLHEVSSTAERNEYESQLARVQVGSLPACYYGDLPSGADREQTNTYRGRPNIVISKTLLNLPEWLRVLARNDDPASEIDLAFRHGVTEDCNPLLYNDMTLWHFSRQSHKFAVTSTAE
ncbi:hypothetical protein MMYC01_207677 [Madurella mycetomatis]|uniref:2EXR domain-containing protein n=1 Tax=Madurella mycetomatis TaxID=100816 RepID=A0A175W0Y6_9PEZI|nr:hypothetical protein MMYC01_207677 [Madurella mycetomatis]